jgi:hypothetical protein
LLFAVFGAADGADRDRCRCDRGSAVNMCCRQKIKLLMESKHYRKDEKSKP